MKRLVQPVILVFLTALFVASGSAAHAQTEASSDDAVVERAVEPIVIEETLPNEVGEWALRWSADYFRRGSEMTARSPRAQLFFGIVDRVGAEIDVPFVLERGDTRRYALGDVSTSLKWLAVGGGDPRGGLALTVGAEIAWPTGSAASGGDDGVVEVRPFVGVLKPFGGATLQGNVGWSRQIRADGDEALTYGWALALPTPRPRLHVLAEVTGGWAMGDEASSLAIAPGFRYGVNSRMSLALACPIGILAGSPRWGVVTQWQLGL